MTPSPQETPRAGMLLVATPSLMDPNFVASVVLLLESDADGALGVILNRPSTLPVAGVLSQWADFVAQPDVLFRGGPVAQDGALGLGTLAEPDQEPLGFRRVASDMGIVDLDTPVDLMSGAVHDVRIFVGYAGWDAAQLLDEIDEGSWYLVPGDPQDAFRADVADLHRDVLRRQPGALAWRATRPLHPEQN